MVTLPFALYDAFSDTAFGGSQAAVVSDAAAVGVATRRRIAGELGLPATGFVTACDGNAIGAQFFSALGELPMCGHGTLGLITRMVEQETLRWSGGGRIEAELRLPSTTARVDVERRDDGRPLVMLDIHPPSFRSAALDLVLLRRLLGIGGQDFAPQLPVEISSGDFVHLVVPAKDLAVMRKIDPDFAGLARYCRDNGLGTVAVFCTEVERPGSTLHVRDFCPAVGVAESAAAGTTNAALTCYLVRHAIVRPDGDGRTAVHAEQGHEIGRPSSIRSVVSTDSGAIVRLQVGGVATKIADGRLSLADPSR